MTPLIKRYKNVVADLCVCVCFFFVLLSHYTRVRLVRFPLTHLLNMLCHVVCFIHLFVALVLAMLLRLFQQLTGHGVDFGEIELSKRKFIFYVRLIY